MVVEPQSLQSLSAEELRELTTRLMTQLRHQSALLDKLTHENALLKRMKFAAQSERFNPEQKCLLEDEIEADLAAVATEIDALQDAQTPAKLQAITPITSLRLLDLTKLERVEPPKMTLLDVGYLDAQHLKTFLKSLVKKMSKPKGRSDELSYLSTQVVFEYLRLRFGKQVDGLVFPSVQTGEQGTNLVLFPEASVISPKKFEKPGELKAAFGADPEDPFDPAARLAIVDGSLRFHKVKAIMTMADTYRSIHDLFMSEELRRRLGPLYFGGDEP